jgi:DNA-binding HxlR family transcriptional regulator
MQPVSLLLHRKSRHLTACENLVVATAVSNPHALRGNVSPQRSSGPSPAVASHALALFDVLSRRWALRVVWELSQGDATYRDLASRIPGMSTSVLTDRLRDLRVAGLVDHQHGLGYRLTPDGCDLIALLAPIADWAEHVGFAEGLAHG